MIQSGNGFCQKERPARSLELVLLVVVASILLVVTTQMLVLSSLKQTGKAAVLKMIDLLFAVTTMPNLCSSVWTNSHIWWYKTLRTFDGYNKCERNVEHLGWRFIVPCAYRPSFILNELSQDALFCPLFVMDRVFAILTRPRCSVNKLIRMYQPSFILNELCQNAQFCPLCIMDRVFGKLTRLRCSVNN